MKLELHFGRKNLVSSCKVAHGRGTANRELIQHAGKMKVVENKRKKRGRNYHQASAMCQTHF